MQSEAHLCICLGSVNEGYIYWAFMELKGRPCRTPNGNCNVGLGLLNLMVPCPCFVVSLLAFLSVVVERGFPVLLRPHLFSLVEEKERNRERDSDGLPPPGGESPRTHCEKKCLKP